MQQLADGVFVSLLLCVLLLGVQDSLAYSMSAARGPHGGSALSKALREATQEARAAPGPCSKSGRKFSDVSHRLEYMPKHNIVSCACAKCGSTSLYNFMYEQEFGHPWSFTGRPFIHQTTSLRWGHAIEAVRDPQRQRDIVSNSYSFAVIRDPKERLISSWRSMVACDFAKTNVDVSARETIVPELRELQGRESNTTCLSLVDFLSALRTIHENGDEGKLNVHFLPQNLGCFRHAPPSSWSKVVTMKDPNAFEGLAKAFGNNSSNVTVPKRAARPSGIGRMRKTSQVEKLLDEVTANEYAVLGKYLPTALPKAKDQRTFEGLDKALGNKSGNVAKQAASDDAAAHMPRVKPALFFKQLGAHAANDAPQAGGDEGTARVPQVESAVHAEDHEAVNASQAHLDYLPSHNLVVCSCAKCGSTSLYGFLYMMEFGREWPYSGPRFVQDVTSSRWEKRAVSLQNVEDQRSVMAKAVTFALVRDPRQRLISAWKSKVACDEEHTGVNKEDRATIIPELLRLAGWAYNGTNNSYACLSFDKFARALLSVHEKGRSMYLNSHFRPQDQWCFRHFPANTWNVVADVKAEQPFQLLSERVANGTIFPDFRSRHRSRNTEVQLSAKTLAILRKVTAAEYKMLSPYLPKATAVEDDCREGNQSAELPSNPEGPEAVDDQSGAASHTLAGQHAEAVPRAEVEDDRQEPSSAVAAGVQEPNDSEAAGAATSDRQDGVQKATPSWPSTPGDFHVNYLPKYNLVVCACSACGSSQIFNHIYEHEFGRHWPHGSQPRAQWTAAKPWKGTWEKLTKMPAMDQVMRKASSLAWAIDPIDRLLTAWSRKVACDRAGTNVSKKERAVVVRDLRRLQARSTTNITCLSFTDFVRALHTIHKEGKANLLHQSFLPQSQECFQKFPVSRWTQVIDAMQPNAMAPLLAALGEEALGDSLSLVSTTRTRAELRSRLKKVPGEVKQLLAEVTRSEYEALGVQSMEGLPRWGRD